MKRLSFLIVVLYLSMYAYSNSQLYVGGGVNYLMPDGDFADYNKDALGINLQIEYRQYCKLWLGLRFGYADLKSLADTTSFYFSNLSELTPQLKYAPFTDNCYDYKFIPYIIGQISISSLTGTDNLSKIGLGAGLGIGAAYNFKLMDRCWMIEINSIYSGPNSILSAEGRTSIGLINSAITLSVGL